MAVKANFFKALGAAFALYKVAAYLRQQKRMLDQLAFHVRALRFVNLTAQEIILQLVLDLDNRTSGNISAGQFDFDIYLDGQKIARAMYNDFVKVQRYSVTTITLDLRIKYNQLGTIGTALLQKLATVVNSTVRLKGEFRLETVPGVYVPLPIDVEQKLGEFL